MINKNKETTEHVIVINKKFNHDNVETIKTHNIHEPFIVLSENKKKKRSNRFIKTVGEYDFDINNEKKDYNSLIESLSNKKLSGSVISLTPEKEKLWKKIGYIIDNKVCGKDYVVMSVDDFIHMRNILY